MNFITKIIEPKKLHVMWQEPMNHSKLCIAELIRNQDKVDFCYLVGTPDFDKAKSYSEFKGYPAFSLDKACHQDVLDVFLRRIPPKSRSDFNKYLESLRISSNIDISDFALLGYSNAKLPSDDFFILHPYENCDTEFQFMIQISGFRHYDYGMKSLNTKITQGTVVIFQKEPENKYDSKAISICHEGNKIGNVSKGILETFHKLLNENRIKSAVIERINGTEDNPNVYVFVDVSC